MATKKRTGNGRSMEVLRWVERYHHAHGYMPSIREIGTGMQFKSTMSVRWHLTKLERLGWVKLAEGGRARALVITLAGLRALDAQ